MKASERLKEIEENWPQRKQFPNATFVIDANELDWLICRVKKLTNALDLIANPGTQSLYECRDTARRAIEAEE